MADDTPSPVTWAGGPAALRAMIDRFVALMSLAADDADLPADPDRSAVLAHVEWVTRLAMANSQPGAAVVEHAPVPRWGWGVAPPRTG